jgi:hypothetical protein
VQELITVGLRFRHFAVLAAVATIGLTFSAGALASTYSPNTTGDHIPGKCTASDCTLREAVIKANKHAGADTIVLHGGSTYRLSQPPRFPIPDPQVGDLDIDDAGGAGLVIKSSNAHLATVDAQRINRVFEVFQPATFVRLRIVGGRTLDSGGGVFSVSSLRVWESKIVGNQADGSGGGVTANGGRLVITKSTIANNVADRDTDGSGEGGGVALTVVSKIKRSTISGNRTSSTYGGGGAFLGGNSTLVNVTFANNGATDPAGRGGGFITDNSFASLNAVTIAHNSAGNRGGGFEYAGDSLEVRNSLIAKNTAPNGGPDCDGAVISLGHNLLGTNADCPSFNAGNGDIIDPTPGIGQLRSNGGPTKTIALGADSKAVNHADGMSPAVDQRGVRRHNPDIGAFELVR